jgi:hypothetical protein
LGVLADRLRLLPRERWIPFRSEPEQPESSCGRPLDRSRIGRPDPKRDSKHHSRKDCCREGKGPDRGPADSYEELAAESVERGRPTASIPRRAVRCSERLRIVPSARWRVPWRRQASCAGRGDVVVAAWADGLPPNGGRDCMWRPRAASASRAVRQAKTARAAPATRTGECLRGAEPSTPLRFLVTNPENNSASEPIPARTATMNSALRTTDARPRRSWEASAPCSAEAPTTASTMRSATTTIRGSTSSLDSLLDVTGEARPRWGPTAASLLYETCCARRRVRWASS